MCERPLLFCFSVKFLDGVIDEDGVPMVYWDLEELERANTFLYCVR